MLQKPFALFLSLSLSFLSLDRTRKITLIIIYLESICNLHKEVKKKKTSWKSFTNELFENACFSDQRPLELWIVIVDVCKLKNLPEIIMIW